MANNRIENKTDFEVVGFHHANENADFSKVYDTLEEAQEISRQLISEGYETVILRKEFILLRDEHNEFSSSNVYEFYTKEGVKKLYND